MPRRIKMKGGADIDNLVKEYEKMLNDITNQITKLETDKEALGTQKKANRLKERQLDQTSTKTDAIKKFFEKAMPYIVIVIVIIILIILFAGGFQSKKKRSQTTKRKNPSIWDKITGLFTVPPQLKQVFNMFNFLGSPVESIERPRLYEGRCDNVNWVETDGDGNLTSNGDVGYCETIKRPKDIQWVMNKMQMSEFNELPKNVKDGLVNYFKVTIPYDTNPEAFYYVPQCEKAYYTDTCTNPSDPSTCVKADLFEDTGPSCRLKEQVSLTYVPGTRCTSSSSVEVLQQNAIKNPRIYTLLNKLIKTINNGRGLQIASDEERDKITTEEVNNPSVYPQSMYYPLLNAVTDTSYSSLYTNYLNSSQADVLNNINADIAATQPTTDTQSTTTPSTTSTATRTPSTTPTTTSTPSTTTAR